MKPLAEWLKDQAAHKAAKSARPSHRSAPKRGRIASVGKKRGEALKVYAVKRRAFLWENRFCYMGKILLGSFCPCDIHATDIHHVAGRIGKKLNDEADWLPVCRPCHNWIHAHPSQARKLGLLR